MRRARSIKTTGSGAVAGLALIAAGMDSDEPLVRACLVIAGAALIVAGAVARDADVSSEGERIAPR